MQKKPYAFSKSIFNRTYFQYCITGNHILSQCENIIIFMRNWGQNETAGLNEAIMQKRKSPLSPLSFDHRHYGLFRK